MLPSSHDIIEVDEMFQNVDGEWSQRGRVGDDMMNLMLKVSIRHQWIMDTW